VKKREKDERGKKRPKRDGPFFFSFSESHLYKNTPREYEEDEREEHYCCDSF
tara:strand:- start:5320 stop:5475 length:156 start_codon:yes stop_codon:yes gene_type:complete